MWNLGRNKKTPEASEFLFPSKKEFWPICGEFWDWSTGRNKRGCYGLCSCSTDSICPPEGGSCQKWFYQHCMTKDIPQTAPSVVLIEDISRSDGWGKTKKF